MSRMSYTPKNTNSGYTSSRTGISNWQKLSTFLPFGLGSNQASMINTNQTIQANKAEAELAYNRELDMWNRMNEYNAPVNQMGRFKEAGLNPAMMFGKGSAVAGNASTLPKYNAPRIDYGIKGGVNLPGAIAQYQDFKMKNAQIDNVNEHTQAKRLDNTYSEGTMNTRIQTAMVNLLTKEFNMSASKARSLIYQENAKLAKQKAEAELARTQAQAGYYEHRKGISKEELDMLEKGLTKSDSKIIRALFQNWPDFINYMNNLYSPDSSGNRQWNFRQKND